MGDQADKPRPIDRLRDGAGSLEIRTVDDDTPISGMISTGDRLLVVKGKGIYEIKRADQIDPERTNIATPNTAQRVIPYGVDTPWVGAVILMAHHFFHSFCAPKEVDCVKAFSLVLEMAEDIAGAYQIEESYRNAEKVISKSVDPKIRHDRSFIIPAVGNVESRCNEFLQRADHAVKGLFKIVQVFYAEVGSGVWESFKNIIDEGPQGIDNFPRFLAEIIPFLQLIRNARNCVEHPKAQQRLVIKDFSLDSQNVLHPPTIEIIHPKTSQEEKPVGVFFEQALQKLVTATELMMVFLCNRHVKSAGGIAVQVIELPPERQKSKHFKYGYGAIFGDRIVPMG
jgi:hypothetical protein